jgi:tetratricopeptide (TPR) repeat protein/ADP-heptose:LPS heptosyltransferase
MNRRERRVAASKSKGAASSTSADAPGALYEVALQHMQSGRRMDALLCCQRILAIDAGHIDTLQLMGLLSLQAKNYDDAIEWVGQANRLDPSADYLTSLGHSFEQNGLHEQARKAFETAIKQNPDDAELLTLLANVLVVLERPADAILSYERALNVDPRYWFAAHNCGVLLLKLERFEEALAKLNLCDELKPDHLPTIQSKAWALYKLARFEAAMSEDERARALNPVDGEIPNNIGAAMCRLGRYEDALAQFDRALQTQPNFVGALNNKALALTELRRFDDAIATYRRVKKIEPANAEADWHVSLIQLLRGDYESGWRGREARWNVASLPGTAAYPKFSQPMWRGGQSLAGKTILVCADEGMGDTIQFVRYLPMLADQGARVILLPQEPLYPLLAKQPGISQCLPNLRGGLPPFDFHCPIMSLPLAFGTRLETIPASASYLPQPDEARIRTWEDRLGHRDRPRIGLVWSGSLGHRNDHNRSIRLQTFSCLIVPGATFVSLQTDPRPDDELFLRERTDIIDHTRHLTDFAETAALVSCLDLVITVDTSVAHLAAALGRPTWILLPAVPDWRWLLDRKDSPWYPTVRLFRQTAARSYEPVLDRIQAELKSLIEMDGSKRTG